MLSSSSCLIWNSLQSAQASEQRQSKPNEAQRPVLKQPFGSAVAAAPAFGNPLPRPAQATGAQQTGSGENTPAEKSSSAVLASEDEPWLNCSNTAGTPQPDQGPFGRSAGVFVLV